MRATAVGSPGRIPNSSMNRPPRKAVAKSHVMRARWPNWADARSDTTPPEGRDTTLSRPETAAMPPPRVWESEKWFWKYLLKTLSTAISTPNVAL